MDRLVRKLLFLASRPLTAPVCPLDGTELDLHFHGGASCPTCGSEFELGREDRILPSDRSIEEHAQRWPDTFPHFATEDWAPMMGVPASRPDQPYPFIYHPETGNLWWGRQNGLHDEIVNDLYRQGMRVPPGAVQGRYFPMNANHNVIVYDPTIPQRDLEKHVELIRRNAPVRPPEAAGGPSSNSWGTLSSAPGKDTFPPEEEEWVPTIPTLDEMVEIERLHRPVE